MLDPLRVRADFWRLGPVTAALAAQNYPDLFKLLQKHQGASQTKIAAACDLTQANVSRIIHGHRPSSYDVINRIATGLDMPDHARVTLGLAPLDPSTPLSMAQPPHIHRPFLSRWPVSGIDGDDGLRHVLDHAEATNEPVAVSIMSGDRFLDLRLSRREFAEVATGLLAASLVSQHADDASAPLDPALIDHFAALRTFLVDADNRLGGLSILPTVHQQAGLIGEFRRQARGPMRDRLLSTEARWAEFAGWLCDDLGDLHSGTRWLHLAMDLSQEADDAEFTAFVLARKAQRAAAARDDDRSVGLAKAAARSPQAPALVRAFAAVQQAHGHAIAGQRYAFQEAIDTARDLTEPIDPQQTDLGSFCTPAYVQAHEGEAWLRLGEPARAVACFDAAIAEWPASYSRDRGLCLARAAAAHLSSDDPERAAHTAREALAVAATTRSARIRREVERLTTDAARLPDQAALRSLLDTLAGTGRATRRGPTSGPGTELDVVFFGRANVDLTVRVPSLPRPGRTTFGSSLVITPGGKSLNQAMSVTRLGGTAGLVANVGDDDWGRMLRDALAAAHVDAAGLRLVPGTTTGAAIIHVTPDGEGHLVLALSPKTELTPTDVHNALSTLDAQVLVTQLDMAPDTVDAVLSSRGSRTVVGNLTPHPGVTSHHLAQLDVFVVNQHEAAVTLGVDPIEPLAAAQQLRQRGPSTVIVTAGGDGGGAARTAPGERSGTVPAIKAPVVDTTGAGDAFLGSLALQLSRRATIAEAIAEAMVAGSMAVQHQGPHRQPPPPSTDHEVDKHVMRYFVRPSWSRPSCRSRARQPARFARNPGSRALHVRRQSRSGPLPQPAALRPPPRSQARSTRSRGARVVRGRWPPRRNRAPSPRGLRAAPSTAELFLL